MERILDPGSISELLIFAQVMFCLAGMFLPVVIKVKTAWLPDTALGQSSGGFLLFLKLIFAWHFTFGI